MDVIIALIFFSLTLVIAGLLFFFSRLFEGDFEHGERLSLLPLEDDDGLPLEKSDKMDSNGAVQDPDNIAAEVNSDP